MLSELIDFSVRPAAGRSAWGRPRLKGDWPAAYLAYVLAGFTGVQRFWTDTSSEGLWERCGFDGVPSHSEVQRQFQELEGHSAAFATVAQMLIRQARGQEPRVGQIVFVDATQWVSSAALVHCCPPGACPKSHTQRRSNVRDPLAALEAHWAEDDAPEPDEDSQCERTRRDVVFVQGLRGKPRSYQRYLIDGCWYRSLDITSGVRTYTGTSTSWFGGYLQAGVDFFTGAPLAVEVYPADIMEWDHYPKLFASMVAALGEAPYVVSVDRGYSIRKFFEFNTRRGVSVVAPRRERTGKPTHQDWRTEAFDEDGIPRCQACGNEGHQDGPGLGLTFVAGEPRIRYRCAIPIHDRCKGIQSIRCSEEWAMLLPLSSKTELYHSVRHAHHNLERTFGQFRRRYSVAGKDASQRICRSGAQAQQLRANAALLLDWYRLSLCQGWQEAETRDGMPEPKAPILRSGTQDLTTGEVLRHGYGSKRLGELNTRRHLDGLDAPYGIAWQQMKQRLLDEAAS